MHAYKTAAALAAFAVSGSLMAETLVTVNGSKIDSEALNHRVQTLQAQSQGQLQDSPQLRAQLLNGLITEAVVTQEAKRLKLDKKAEVKSRRDAALKEAKARGDDKKPGFKWALAQFEYQLLVNAYAADLLAKQPVSDAEVVQHYNNLAVHYKDSDTVQLGEIISDKPEQIQAALKALRGKQSFRNVAKKYSSADNVEATGGIDSAYLPLADLKAQQPWIYQAVAPLGKGKYTTQAVTIPNTQIQVIFYVNDRQKFVLRPLAEVQQALHNDLAQARLNQAVAELQNKAKIVPAK
ncbi:peptidyl-prolyl cis-trans isomerase C [Neisseria sp. HSC-16F19]|nr:SurA N-terminal domain-containing protein [Neisseria sp. HSC-16F19]MCP2041304.1 peptidyl-prolyl cis-trans isomerase C [Neisseria sp. HSC-16F19]